MRPSSARRLPTARRLPAARRLPTATVPLLVALLLAGCAVSNTTEDPLPTGGEVTGDTSVIETPTGEATE